MITNGTAPGAPERSPMPKRTTTDWMLEAVSLAILASIFVNLAAHWAELPDRVPAHYGFLGDPNRWGGKNGLWVLPVTAVALYILATAASRYQRLINLPFCVDRQSPEVRRILLTMTIVLKGTLLAILAYINWAGINTAMGRAQGLGRNFLPVFLAAIFGPLIFYTRKLWPYRT
jgi:uncharacterized membrane protein YidH (DUF202 family)